MAICPPQIGSNRACMQGNLGEDVARFYRDVVCGMETADESKGNCSGVVLDVGAFLGTHSLMLAKLGYEVHAFEVQPNAAELIRCSASANGLADSVHVTEEGISDVNGFEWCGIHIQISVAYACTMLHAPRDLYRYKNEDQVCAFVLHSVERFCDHRHERRAHACACIHQHGHML